MRIRATVRCPVCEARAARTALFCRRCGTSFGTRPYGVARWFFGLSAVFLIAGSGAAAALLPMELRRLSLAVMGLGFLASGSILLWASLILLKPPRGGEAQRLLALHALESARIEPLPTPARGEFIDRFLARRNRRPAPAGARF